VVGVEHVSTSFWMTIKLQVTSTAPAANFSGYYVSFTDNRGLFFVFIWFV